MASAIYGDVVVMWTLGKKPSISLKRQVIVALGGARSYG